jgi:ABC-type amino acid transport substrate-binding protein
MRRRVVLLCVLLCGLFTIPVSAQNAAPTLIPPTPVPYNTSAESETALSESAVSRIVANNRLRVGILYTEPAFGQFTERGEVRGYDADLAAAIAETWGVELRLRQVTRQTAFEMLYNNEVDVLIAAMVHRRDLDDDVEFSQTYYQSAESVMVRSDDGANTLADLNGRSLGVVLSTPSETALRDWAARSGFNGSIQTFPTYDRLYGALGSGGVDGIVAPRHRLRQLAALEPEARRLLDEPIEILPYAIAFRRQDAPLRTLINRTLQHLQRSGKLDELRRIHFTDERFDGVPVWANLSDAPKPTDVSSAIIYPSAYVIPRIQSNGVLRVAGPWLTSDQFANATESERRLDRFHRELINALTRRWNVSLDLISMPAADAAQAVADGRADLAIGLPPDWQFADRIDFAAPYLVHGLRLMVKSNANIFSFEELRGGKIVATTFNEPNSAAAAVREAERVNALIRSFQTDESSLALQILQDKNADVAFADSFKLLPHIEAYPNDLTLTNRWYTREYYALAVPLNDIDFRLLVEYSIQELVRDGTLRQLWNGLVPAGDQPNLDIYPGPRQFLGYMLG